MKGIILAGRNGSRLYPLTLVSCKQLLPVYNIPMIYYRLAVLMEADIRNILIICRSTDKLLFEKLLGNGEKFGINISYAIQEKAEGIAQAISIGEKFIGEDPIVLILGDNIIIGDKVKGIIKKQ